MDAGCNVTDATLIQAGTEQDVSKSGKASYSAWYELFPAPSITISNLPVRAGDSIIVTIGEVVPGSEVWSIVVKNSTTGKPFSTTLPCTSTHATAEWIEETPLIIGTGGTGLSAFPKLSTVQFDLAKVNGSGAGLKSSEEIQLVDANSGADLATPSGPDSDKDGFNDCSYATSCSAPSSS